jgi:predicted dehydrogenase
MATNLDDAKAMIDASRRNDKKLLIGLTRRFKGDSQRMKEVVDSGELGEIYYTKCGWMRRNGIPGWGSWFTREKDAGAGPIYDIGVHTLDLAFWLASNFEPMKVLASKYTRFGNKQKGLGDWGIPNYEGYYDVEDLASALIKMKNGATVAFDVSWAANIEKSEFSVKLMGDKGGLDLEKMTVYTPENDRKLKHVEADPYYREMSHFIDCIINDREPVTKPNEMLALQKTLDMILLSSREDRIVDANEI